MQAQPSEMASRSSVQAFSCRCCSDLKTKQASSLNVGMSHYPLDIYIQEKELVLEPFLFNSKYSLTLQALVSHFEWVSPTYLIAGVHTLKMVKTTSRSLPRQTLHAPLYALYVLYILILFSYAGATL